MSCCVLLYISFPLPVAVCRGCRALVRYVAAVVGNLMVLQVSFTLTVVGRIAAVMVTRFNDTIWSYGPSAWKTYGQAQGHRLRAVQPVDQPNGGRTS